MKKSQLYMQCNVHSRTSKVCEHEIKHIYPKHLPILDKPTELSHVSARSSSAHSIVSSVHGPRMILAGWVST